MKTMIYYCAIVLVALGTLQSCAPKPITEVALHQEDVGYWHRGTAIGDKSADDVALEVVFSHQDKKYIYFDVAVYNEGDKEYLIDPSTMRLNDLEHGGIAKAVDPELMIIAREMKVSRRRANIKTAAIVGTIAVAAGTVAAVASSNGGGSSSDDDCDDDNDDTYYSNNYFIANNVPTGPGYMRTSFYDEPLLSSPSYTLPRPGNPEFWRSYALRKTTLQKGERMRGLVAFIYNENRRVYELVAPINGQNLTYKFTQTEHKP